MKRNLLNQLVALLLIFMAATGLQAQVREVLLRANADVTLLKDFPDVNSGHDLNNQLCNFDSIGPYGGTNSPEETWVRWDLGAIESEIGEGEEILYVEAVFRVSWNSDDPEIAQGFRTLHLDNSFDFWNEGNGVPGGAVDNLDGLTWNKAKGINDFEDASMHDTLYVKQQATILPSKEFVPVLEAVQNELSEDGNKLLTLRLVPFYTDLEMRKKWLGFIALQSPAGAWSLEVDEEGFPLDAPQLKFYIGKNQDQFSDGAMGRISNYNLKPEEFGYWMVANDEGDARMQLMKKTEIDQEKWNPGAVAVFKDAVYQDFEISLKAKMNYTTPSGAFFPYNDFIMAFGYEDPDNFSYYAFYGNDESGAFKVADGIRSRIGEANPIPAMIDTSYHSYKVVRAGSLITVFIDGTEYHSITDDMLNTEGKVGFGSHNDVVFFDDFTEKDYGVGVENHADRGFVVFPNPASSQINIHSTGSIQSCKVLDICGKVVLSGQNLGSGNIILDISGLQNGIYILNVNIAGERFAQKIIKR